MAPHKKSALYTGGFPRAYCRIVLSIKRAEPLEPASIAIVPNSCYVELAPPAMAGEYEIYSQMSKDQVPTWTDRNAADGAQIDLLHHILNVGEQLNANYRSVRKVPDSCHKKSAGIG